MSVVLAHHKERKVRGGKGIASETQGNNVTKRIIEDLSKRSFLEGETFFNKAC